MPSQDDLDTFQKLATRGIDTTKNISNLKMLRDLVKDKVAKDGTVSNMPTSDSKLHSQSILALAKMIRDNKGKVEFQKVSISEVMDKLDSDPVLAKLAKKLSINEVKKITDDFLQPYEVKRETIHARRIAEIEQRKQEELNEVAAKAKIRADILAKEKEQEKQRLEQVLQNAEISPEAFYKPLEDEVIDHSDSGPLYRPIGIHPSPLPAHLVDPREVVRNPARPRRVSETTESIAFEGSNTFGASLRSTARMFKEPKQPSPPEVKKPIEPPPLKRDRIVELED